MGKLDRRMAASVDRMTDQVDKYTESIKLPIEDFRQPVREYAERQWGEPAVAAHLGTVKPHFDVPGRRADGTIKGKRLIRRFFYNIIRGVFVGVANVFALVLAGGVGNPLQRDGSVQGPENALALGLVDAAKPAKYAWLVYSESHVAIIDAGPDTPLTVLWHAEKPHAPRIKPTRWRLTWSDGSEVNFSVSFEEVRFQKRERRAKLGQVEPPPRDQED